MKTSDTLNTAADLIEEHGWARGSGWPGINKHSKLCLEGGIMAALGIQFHEAKLTEFWACPAYRAVMQHLSRDEKLAARNPGWADTPTEPLWEWNDNQSTSERVIEVLRATAVIEQAKEESAEIIEAALIEAAKRVSA